MASQKIWRLKTPNPAQQKILSDALKISPVTAQILINRGIDTVEAAQTFLNPKLKDLPNPFLLPDMEKGVRRIIQAIAKKESIAIYGDYDVDGITSTALLSLFFKTLGVSVRGHIPDRIKEGYGLQKNILEKLKAEGVSLVITADCGTKSFEALEAANAMGLGVIVTDHHEAGAETAPAFALINPKMGGQKIAEELAGCGVAFFLIMALRQKLREENFFTNGTSPVSEPNLKQYLDLVALASIADMAPVTGVNRILVSLGLKELAETKKPGLIALKEISGIKPDKFSTSDIGFRLGPRINAGGRISQSRLGLNLLLAEDLERANGLAKILDQCNQERQAMQEKHVREALLQAEGKSKNRGLVVSSETWHPGIIGLVASKLTQNFYRPSIAFSITEGVAKGSARSISGINIVEVLEKCAEHLEQFGGHAAAAGLTLKQENLQNFEDLFEKILEPFATQDVFTPALHLDSEIAMSGISEKLLEELECLKPFGIGNHEPLFALRQARLSDIRTVGTNHLKFKVSNGESKMDAICFDWKEKLPQENAQADLAFTPQWNSYQGNKTIQLKVKDIIF